MMKQLLQQLENRKTNIQKVYTANSTQYFFFIALILIGVATVLNYFYFSTIGHLSEAYARQICLDYLMRVLLAVGVVTVLELISQFIRHERDVKLMLSNVIKAPTIPYVLLYVLLLSYNISFSALIIGSFVIFICSQTARKGYSYYLVHPISIGYFSTIAIEVSNYAKFGFFDIPTALNSPFTTVLSEQTILTYEQFIAQYYSLETVMFGFFNGATSFTLAIFLLVTCILVIKNRFANPAYVAIYLGGFIMSTFVYTSQLQLENWVFILGLLNGSVLFIATFLLSDSVLLPRSKRSGYLFILAVTALTAYFTFNVHVILGPFLALILIQIIRALYIIGHSVVSSMKTA